MANVARRKDGFTLVVSEGGQRYEYETDDAGRMEHKVAAIIKAKEELTWAIDNSVLLL